MLNFIFERKFKIKKKLYDELSFLVFFFFFLDYQIPNFDFKYAGI
jgi:hypothetical protein